MANMAWNSSMNTARVMEMLTDKDPRDGDYVIPRIIYSDAYASEMVAYADLILPDTTYLERTTASRCSTGRSRDADAAAMRSAGPVLAGPRRAVLPVGAAGPGRAAGPAGDRQRGRQPALSRRLPRLHRPSRARARHRQLAGWRGADGDKHGIGAVNEGAARRLHRRSVSGGTSSGRVARYFKRGQRAYLDWARHGLDRQADPIVLQLYGEPLQKFRSPPKGMAKCSRPTRVKTAIRWRPTSIRCRSGTAARGRDAVDARRLPAARDHAAADGDVPRWDSQNAWLRQIHGDNRLTSITRRRRGSASTTATGSGHLEPSRAHQGADQADGGRQPATRSGRGTPSASAAAPGRSTRTRPEAAEGLPAQPPHFRAAARARDGIATPMPIR
jgi:hypothetical protein